MHVALPLHHFMLNVLDVIFSIMVVMPLMLYCCLARTRCIRTLWLWIGGGGFFLLKRHTETDFTFIDARETAPKNTNKIDYQKNQDYLKYGPLAIGTPGIPSALDHIFKNYSSLEINSLIYPSIKLANHGFEIDNRFANAIKRKKY